MQLDWDHPVFERAGAAPTDGTVALAPRRALPPEEALAYIAGEDRRPLLVLRECLRCAGTEDALLNSGEDNERTYVLSRWFHCIKLPPDVLEPDHPFRNLFPGEDPAHLFIANRDGSGRHDLAGDQSRRELWGAMDRAIADNYRGDHQAAVQKLSRILDDLDEVDRSLAALQTRYELAVATDDPDRIRKLQKELSAKRARRAELLEQANLVSVLELEPPAAK
jgi:hypothetical protein